MTTDSLPDFLCHYYERASGPFRSFSMLAPEEANALQAALRARGDVFASQRAEDYLAVRRELEQRVRALFIAKGGRPIRERPHYLILGANPWLLGWYREGCELRLPLDDFDPATISFTYGDTFPAMRYDDGLPTQGQVYTLDELPALIAEFGLPQIVNPDGACGPRRYIEAQVWDNAPLRAYLSQT